ncbi:hypothetical protein DYB25_002274 [Aphanomyces astaci]|uniref:Uncharacterized protein n=2 Tax=Aphanomyces astaci TaxID=112090 RepID=A0A397BK34_APHAT|nr:hypothetical protein DYB25_002274 [Aphanomyces astaci]RHY60932.1 hypothetical protein DYB30_003809 [Aphanomyces astaci]RHZ41951.1 hypothetical protein DYB26_003061 [Aphanomyces astaci]
MMRRHRVQDIAPPATTAPQMLHADVLDLIAALCCLYCILMSFMHLGLSIFPYMQRFFGFVNPIFTATTFAICGSVHLRGWWRIRARRWVVNRTAKHLRNISPLLISTLGRQQAMSTNDRSYNDRIRTLVRLQSASTVTASDLDVLREHLLRAKRAYEGQGVRGSAVVMLLIAKVQPYPTDPLTSQKRRLLAPFSRQGMHYEARLLVRECIVLPMQFFRGYNNSNHLSSPLTTTFGVVLGLHCVVVAPSFVSNLNLLPRNFPRARTRREHLVVTIVLFDLVLGVVLPLSLAVPVIYSLVTSPTIISDQNWDVYAISVIKAMLLAPEVVETPGDLPRSSQQVETISAFNIRCRYFVFAVYTCCSVVSGVVIAWIAVRSFVWTCGDVTMPAYVQCARHIRPWHVYPLWSQECHCQILEFDCSRVDTPSTNKRQVHLLAITPNLHIMVVVDWIQLYGEMDGFLESTAAPFVNHLTFRNCPLHAPHRPSPHIARFTDLYFLQLAACGLDSTDVIDMDFSIFSKILYVCVMCFLSANNKLTSVPSELTSLPALQVLTLASNDLADCPAPTHSISTYTMEDNPCCTARSATCPAACHPACDERFRTSYYCILECATPACIQPTSLDHELLALVRDDGRRHSEEVSKTLSEYSKQVLDMQEKNKQLAAEFTKMIEVERRKIAQYDLAIQDCERTLAEQKMSLGNGLVLEMSEASLVTKIKYDTTTVISPWS